MEQLIRCACGKLTNFGLLCVRCSTDRLPSNVELEEISVEDLIEEEESISQIDDSDNEDT
jgi:hypothetical protein